MATMAVALDRNLFLAYYINLNFITRIQREVVLTTTTTTTATNVRLYYYKIE